MKLFNYKISIIGMPGSGKSTIGNDISKLIGYEFYDIDEIIKIRFGMSISEIFTKKGEKKFRQYEKEEFEKILKKKDKILISTGGGFIMINGENLKKTFNI